MGPFSIFTSFAPRLVSISIAVLITPFLVTTFQEDYVSFIRLNIIGALVVVLTTPLQNIFSREAAKSSTKVFNSAIVGFVLIWTLTTPLIFLLLVQYLQSTVAAVSGTFLIASMGVISLARTALFRDGYGVYIPLIEALFLVCKFWFPIVIVRKYFNDEIEIFMALFVLFFILECLLFLFLIVNRGSKHNISISFFFQTMKQNLRLFLYGALVASIEALWGIGERVLTDYYLDHDDLITIVFSLTVASVVYIVPAQINSISFNYYFENWTNKKLFEKKIKSDLNKISLYALAYIGFLYTVGEFLISIWLSKDGISNQIRAQTFSVSLLLSIAAYFNAISGPFRSILIAAKREVYLLNINIFIVFCATLAFFITAEDVFAVAQISIIAYLLRLICYIMLTYDGYEKR